MINEEERQEEQKAEDDERGNRMERAANKWKDIGDHYDRNGGRHGPHDCCYFCEAGRVFNRAAADYTKAGNHAAEAEEALKKAGEAFKKCGERCFEAGDLLCAELGLAQAKLVYERLKAKATAAKKVKDEQDADKALAELGHDIEGLDEYKKKLEKDHKEALDAKK
jgi:hypothetical protein